ncbi:hypothetical protein AXF42_Ash010786 [Apostasia shenzhenica]|uniref:Uncharacterized protein n=1 Tax=Apostasia shenzhenica TaxID=1088818 RepID=A0A2I0A0P1_9ASPA|nr:hypothetical protein AXF42_Ash010786 [Apostasia shenzhenica]
MNSIISLVNPELCDRTHWQFGGGLAMSHSYPIRDAGVRAEMVDLALSLARKAFASGWVVRASCRMIAPLQARSSALKRRPAQCLSGSGELLEKFEQQQMIVCQNRSANRSVNMAAPESEQRNLRDGTDRRSWGSLEWIGGAGTARRWRRTETTRSKHRTA